MLSNQQSATGLRNIRNRIIYFLPLGQHLARLRRHTRIMKKAMMMMMMTAKIYWAFNMY